ncbi:MAG: quinolinate synthase NadA [Candidatus Korarchaeum sp.]
MRRNALVEEVRRLKIERRAVILGHNYMDLEVQLVSDFTGDSYDLALKAASTEADVILFAGVRFMIEQAKALNYEREVLSPDLNARCTVADSLDKEILLEYKERFPEVPVVLYINSNLEAKALADYIVTSSTAAKAVRRIPSDTVILGPDVNLATYVERVSGKRVIKVPPNGKCIVHASYIPTYVEEAKRKHPKAKLLVHPEAPPEVLELADFVGSTNQMIEFARSDSSEEFIVGTELGMLNSLKLRVPNKYFYPLTLEPFARCPFMAMITLEKVYRSLRDSVYRIEIPRNIAEAVRESFERTRKLLSD